MTKISKNGENGENQQNGGKTEKISKNWKMRPKMGEARKSAKMGKNGQKWRNNFGGKFGGKFKTPKALLLHPCGWYL